MKKLHSIAFYALVTPVITLASSAVLAQQTTDQNSDRGQSATQHTDQSTPTSTHDGQTTPRVGQSGSTGAQGNQSTPRTGQSGSTGAQTGQDIDLEQDLTQRTDQGRPTDTQTGRTTPLSDQSNPQTVSETLVAAQKRMEHRGYMNAAPARGMQVSDLVGAKVSTAGNENVGPVEELLINEDGQIVAIVVSVGGFLGMGQKDVAIGWGHVTRSGAADDQELRIDVTREELRAAPEYEKLD